MEILQPRVKEETLTQISRRGRDGQPGGEDLQQGGSWQSGQSHIYVRMNWEEQLGSQTEPGFQVWK